MNSEVSPHQPVTMHTEVIVVGNGPSAISLSYMLAGNRPFYNGLTLSNEFLTRRLQENMGISLVDQDLPTLSEGLEGRSNNPVALLFDSLFHPDADFGADIPSVLEWNYQPQNEIPHVILGKTKPGGTWQKIDGAMQTISQNSWMELPGVPFKEWLAKQRHTTKAENMLGRATISDVKEYYSDYVKTQRLSKYFKDFHTVTSVQRVFHLRNHVDSESGEVEPCCQNVRRNHTHCWEVRGYHTIMNDEGQPVARREFCYVAPHVVLATGAYDIPNRLGVDGENLPCVVHCLGELEQQILNCTQPDPVVVVGAGLSAADAILMAMESNIPVIHVFRRNPTDPSLIFSKLPKSMYPEYHQIHNLMKGKETNELYKALPRHTIVEIIDNKVLVKSKLTDSLVWFDVSCVAIMIGSRSDLGFLPREGRCLGVVPKWPIDSKHNIMDVDAYSYQSIREPQMFAMGPLVGDNFVRFAIGGALGIVSHINKCRKKDTL
ncbi:oxidative stress-induced growth inhibitor 2-like [Physella acuta]|uniref:oxidative stress-induced growth inhibitor 2-like n=1 Tax=Physella acuta TaxID=109671 RepID=UPI0027DD49CD|nr:oxidative stress-induced growth inhibitor 2-like [Physella acuta]